MRDRPGSPLNALTLVSYHASVVLPSLGVLLLTVQAMTVMVSSTAWTAMIPILQPALLAVSGAFATVAALRTGAARWRRAWAAVLGSLVIVLAATAVVAYDVFSGLNLGFYLGAPLLFFSWAIARPFRGKGYFAVLLWAGLVVVSLGGRFLAFPFALLGWPLAGHLVNLGVVVAVVLVPVLAAMAWEGRAPHAAVTRLAEEGDGNAG